MKFKNISPGSKSDPKTILIIAHYCSMVRLCPSSFGSSPTCLSQERPSSDFFIPGLRVKNMLKPIGPGDFEGNSREED